MEGSLEINPKARKSCEDGLQWGKSLRGKPKMQNICLRVLARGLRDQKRNLSLNVPRLMPEGKQRCRRPLQSCSEGRGNTPGPRKDRALAVSWERGPRKRQWVRLAAPVTAEASTAPGPIPAGTWLSVFRKHLVTSSPRPALANGLQTEAVKRHFW